MTALPHDRPLHDERFFSALVEHAMDAILVIDQQGIIQFANPAAAAMFAGKTGALIGTHFDVPAIGDPVEIPLSQNTGISYVELHAQEVLWNSKPVIVAILRDITERKRTEEALTTAEVRYRSTLDNMMEGCQIIGPDWRYLYLNPVAITQSHKSKEELLGHTMMEAYPGIDTTDMFSHLRRCMEQRIPYRFENLFQYPDGARGWFRLNFEPVPEGVFILSEDITREKHLSEELQKHREGLEELVRDRTAQLEAVNKELEAFSYSVSHDLRAPLRHIDGFVQLLNQKSASSLDETGKRYLSVISEATIKMASLIDELLVFSRMGRTEMRKSRVKVARLVADVVSEAMVDNSGRTVSWNIESLPEVDGDPAMLRLVWINLISNALKYTRRKKEAKIYIGCNDGEAELIFYVRDNGVGFDMQFADKLFGVFQRLHRHRDFEGTGIGLANVRRIIDRHNGKTWAEGRIEQGSTFYFSLPKH